MSFLCGCAQRKGAAYPQSKRRSRRSRFGDRIVIWPSVVSIRQFTCELHFLPQVILDRFFLFVFHSNQPTEILMV